MELVAVDIGGTHARFAIARIAAGRVTALGPETTLKTAAHAGFAQAWQAFAAAAGRPLPRAAAIAVAGPTDGEVLKLTNSPWIIRPALIRDAIAVDGFSLVNDFGAVAHAVGQFGPEHFRHLCGPDRPLPADGVVSVIGPGTGLGVAQLVRAGGGCRVIESEGGHIGFAPIDDIDDAILRDLRARLPRVSAERIISGPGLRAIHDALARIEGRPAHGGGDDALWAAALAGDDRHAAQALDRLCLSLGSFAGDIALAQGAQAVVIAGGIGRRIADRLQRSGFARRFAAKGRFEAHMAQLPVKLVTHPQPGLFGAAAAFAQEHP